MSEPRLEDIGDYNTLQGEKKRVVWTVIIVGILLGVVYTFVNNNYGSVNDADHVTQTINGAKNSIPMK